MAKPGKNFGYTIPDSSGTDMTFIAQPESDNPKFLYDKSDTNNSEDEDVNDLKSFKDEHLSLRKEYKADDGEINGTDENYKDTQMYGSFSDPASINWQQLNSFQGVRPIGNTCINSLDSSDTGRTSLDAMSFKEDQNAQGNEFDKPKVFHHVTESDSNAELRKRYTAHLNTRTTENNASNGTFFDAAVVYAENDIAEVIRFVQIVEALVYPKFRYKPLIEYYDQGKFRTSHVSIAEDVLNRASVVFIYLTRNINTDYFDLFTDEAVSLSRLGMNPGHVMPGRGLTDRQWALKPVHTLPWQLRDYKTPAGLVSIRGIDWFNKDTEHTRTTIISIMREARRIREEAERKAVGHRFMAQSQMPGGGIEALLAELLKVQRPQTPANAFQVSPGNRRPGDVTVSFTPSARQHPPATMHQSFGTQYNQPSPHQPYQQTHSFVGPQIPVDRTIQVNPQSQTIVNPNLYHRSSNTIRTSQSNVPTRTAEANPQGTHVPGIQPNRPMPNEDKRTRRSDQTYRNDSDSSDTDTSSSDDSEIPFAPKQKKKHVHIVGCRYVQIGKHNQVLDGTPMPTKRKKGSKSGKVNRETDEPSSFRSEPKPFENKVTIRNRNVFMKGQRETPRTDENIVEEPHRNSLTRTSRQLFQSSVSEDNLSNNTAQYGVNTKDSVSCSEKTSNKDLNLEQFSNSGLTKHTNGPDKSNKTNKFEGPDSASDKVSNVRLKTDEELQEYQLITKRKQKESFNDLDQSESDNEQTISVPQRNIDFESSGEENYVSSRDQDITVDGDQTNGSKEQLPEGQKSSSLLQVHVAHPRRTVINFMDMMKSLVPKLPPFHESWATMESSDVDNEVD